MYENARFDDVSDTLRRECEQRQSLARLVVEFKTELSRDFARRPYEAGSLPSGGGRRWTGRLSGVTERERVVTTPCGEWIEKWSELEPATLLQLAEWYAAKFAATGSPPSQARRYLTLAAFARPLGGERAATNWKRALRLARRRIRARAELRGRRCG